VFVIIFVHQMQTKSAASIIFRLLCWLILYEVADENIGLVSWFTDFVGRFCWSTEPRPQKSADFVVRLTSH